ncbi:MAG: SDR family oxidoreductase [Clostridiales bacterium]|nr:SDR family oxidoreductase [Clostridiales bacterium]
MANRMDGKIAVVTGAASGMGKAIALAYLKENAKVLACDLNTERLGELQQEVEAIGLSDCLQTMRCDVTNAEDCEKAVAACANAFGSCNLLSHNAGITDNWTMLEDMTDDIWQRQINVNLTGSMYMTRAAIQYFLKNEIKGVIVMITSNAAIESSTGGVAYTASKAGANALMKSISYEYARQGIRCNAILPGPIVTNITESAGDRDSKGTAVHHGTGYNAHYSEWTIQRYAMPDQIAPLAVYLGSDESSFVTSASIVIDGGVCLG